MLLELFSLRMRIILRRSCPHDRLSALVFSIRAVLARRPAGADPLSDRVATVAALPRTRGRRPRGTRPGLGRSDASREIAQRTVSSFPRVTAARSTAIPSGGSPSNLHSRFLAYLQVSLSLFPARY